MDGEGLDRRLPSRRALRCGREPRHRSVVGENHRLRHGAAEGAIAPRGRIRVLVADVQREQTLRGNQHHANDKGVGPDLSHLTPKTDETLPTLIVVYRICRV